MSRPAGTPPAVEIVTIGEELLLGETVDGNSAWLGRRLAAAGLRVARRTTVGDDVASIRDAVSRALERTGIVVCTGGLGPTSDDVTRPAVAGLFDRELRVDEDVLASIRHRFESRGVRMPGINRRQAEVPDGARVFPNSRGTAPGIALEDERGRLAILLPGVPFELEALVDEHVLDFLVERVPARGRPIRHRVLHTTGLPESALAERVGDIAPAIAPLTLAFLPAPIGVDLRLTSWGALADAELAAAFDAAESAIRGRVGEHVYGVDDDDLPAAVGRILRRRRLTLAVAESCTAGLLAKRITDRAGASEYFAGGIIAYDNELKHALLGVDPGLIRDHGAVSEAVARAMAEGAARTAAADVALSITGIAGPGGGTRDKPVGTVWIGLAFQDVVEAVHHVLPGDRHEIRDRAAQAALALLWARLRSLPGETGQPDAAS